MAQPSEPLHISLSEIAALTRVKRPVVSMWRTRSRNTDTPFPEPTHQNQGRPLFSANSVIEWLAATQHGNNPQAAADIAAFAKHDAARHDPASAFDSQSALIALRHLVGGPLSGLDAEELLDEADAADPDDEFLYSEIEALGQGAAALARHVDQLVEAAYAPADAFEQLMADRFRAGLRVHAETALSDEAMGLAAGCAVELASGALDSPVFVDSTPGGSDLLVTINQLLPESSDPTFLTRTDRGRTALRRLVAHGMHREALEVSPAGEFSVDRPAVHVAVYPPAGAPAMSSEEILGSLENTVLQMDDTQSGVIVAPAAALTDAPPSAEAAAIRGDLLRSGRVRAVVRLPAGLVPGKTRQSLALWILGPAHASVPIAERWTLVADLSAVPLRPDVVQDLVGDVAVAMGSAQEIRAHSMRFAHLVATSRLLARRGGLVTSQSSAARADAAEQAVRVDRLLAALKQPEAAIPLAVELGRGTPRDATVQELLDLGRLKYRKGVRLDASLPLTDDGGTRVLGLSELGCGDGQKRERRIDLLVLTKAHPAARLTEPGDVVFATTPEPRAVVDTHGGSLVEAPARVLRISATDPGGLMAELLAADVNSTVSKEWRRWRVRLVPESTAQTLRPVLAMLEAEQAAAARRLEHLSQLTTLIRDGVSAGGLVVTQVAAQDLSAPTATIDVD